MLYCPECDSINCYNYSWERYACCEDCGYESGAERFARPLFHEQKKLREEQKTKIEKQPVKQDIPENYIQESCTCSASPECAPCVFCIRH